MASKIMRIAFVLFAALGTATPMSNGTLAPALLDRALTALGGENAISKLSGVTYRAPRIYRSRSLMQSYELTLADTPVAISGHQNISFQFSSNGLEQRIDRYFVPSNYWVWSSPTLDPFDFSLVIRGGDDGFACYVRGNNQIWLPPSLASGYTDAALAEYLVMNGEKLSPKLLLKMKESNGVSALELDINGIRMQAVYDSSLNITVVFNAASGLPYIVRSIEDHPIYGTSTNDLVLSNYQETAGLLFPHSIQTVYNSSSQNLDAVLEDSVIEQVEVDPSFAADFFDGLAAKDSMAPKAAPKRVPGISHAHLSEFSSNMIWGGVTESTVEGLQVEQPVSGLPTVHWLKLDNDTLGVKQLIIEFENEVIVGDAPPQWTSSVIQWIGENLKKPITHLWPTHHHRDHTGGAPEYIAAGAKLIIPEMAVPYWSSIPGATFQTFNATHPYVHVDGAIQAWFLWQEQATHAADWTYAFITTTNPAADAPVALFEADAWQAGMPGEQSDQADMRAWLDQLAGDGVAATAMVLPTHGQVTPLRELVNLTGYPYPEFSIKDWKYVALR